MRPWAGQQPGQSQPVYFDGASRPAVWGPGGCQAAASAPQLLLVALPVAQPIPAGLPLQMGPLLPQHLQQAANALHLAQAVPYAPPARRRPQAGPSLIEQLGLQEELAVTGTAFPTLLAPGPVLARAPDLEAGARRCAADLWRPGPVQVPLAIASSVLERHIDHLGQVDLARAHTECSAELADDVLLLWPDFGVVCQGPARAAGFIAWCLEGLRDMRCTVRGVEQSGPREVRKRFTICGTGQRADIPAFPCGKFMSWECEACVTFNDLGKIKSKVMHFALAAELHVEPSIFEGLGESVLALSSTASGSRILQQAVDVAHMRHHEALVRQLRGKVWEVSGNPHGNHVVQRYIAVMAPELVQFVVDELSGRAVAAAQHRTRCRVLERLLEHCPRPRTAGLVEELLTRAVMLSRHRFGNFVVQHVLEHGTPDQRSRLVGALLAEVSQLARCAIASNVVRSALSHSTEEARQRLVQALTADPAELASLAHHRVGSFVVRELKMLRKAHAARGGF